RLLAGVVLVRHRAGRQAREPDLGICPARTAGLATQLAKMVADLVLCDRAEPAAEGIAGTLLAEPRDMRRDRLEYVLEDVGNLRLRETPAPTPPVHQRRVEHDQAIPGRSIIRLEPLQQASGCRGGTPRSLLAWAELGRTAEVATHIARCRRGCRR